MSLKILICDDSRMARKQLGRCLPPDWDIEILFAEDGREALEVISRDAPSVLFLDLNMPNMDGYETLDEINLQEIDICVIVVSGDIQTTAVERVLALGALDFIKKPCSKETLLDTVKLTGFYPSTTQPETKPIAPAATKKASIITAEDIFTSESAFRDACQEVSNVAMGRAGALLAQFLDAFVELPIPKVNHIELNELNMALQFSDDNNTVSSVCQGFIGPGISGEGLLIFNDSSFENIAQLIKYKGVINDNIQLELLMDIATIIIGACLQGISDQLNLTLSQGHPVVLGQHVKIPELLNNKKKGWDKILAIEINYKIENETIDCDLLLLFTDDSIDELKRRLSYLV